MEHTHVSKLARKGKKLKKILFIGGNPWSLINFRGSFIKELKKDNFSVYSLSNKPNRYEKKQLNDIGVIHDKINLLTNKISIFEDLNYFFNLRRKIKKIKPDIIIAYTIKPVVYTGLNILFFRNKIIFIPMITGVGHYFNVKRFSEKLIKLLVINLLKISFYKVSKVIFQNKDNIQTFIKYKIISSKKISLVEGSGVDVRKFKNLKKYKKLKKKSNSVTFLLMARLQIDKGIIEFLKAADLVKVVFPKTRFLIIGDKDVSNNAVDIKLVENYEKRGVIEYFGFISDVRNFISMADVFVLPSYHEGLPRSSLEAMSMEKPILTTNVAGCKETVINGKNGFKVNVKDVNSLYKKMLWFINNVSKFNEMGKESREIVLNRFSTDIINKKLKKIISDHIND